MDVANKLKQGKRKGNNFWTTNSFQALNWENSFHNVLMRKIALVIFLLNVIIKAQKVYVEIEFKLGSFQLQMPHGFNIEIYCD